MFISLENMRKSLGRTKNNFKKIKKIFPVDVAHEVDRKLDRLQKTTQDFEQKISFRHINQYKKYEDKIIPFKLYFGVTNVCNAKCIFCAYKTAEHKKGIMSFEIFKKGVDEYISMGGKWIALTPTVGDPLIDPGLFDKIKYAKKHSQIKQIHFTTNAILFTNAKKYKKTIDSGITHVYLSMGDLDKETYIKVYGVDLYEKAILGIYHLLKYNKETGEQVIINIGLRTSKKPSETLASEDFNKYIKPFLSKKVTYSFTPYFDNFGGMIKQEHLIGDMKLGRGNKIKTTPCVKTFEAMILFDGSVRLCACRLKKTEFDELVIGNINKNTLKEIFFGENAKKVRERFVQNNLAPVCKGCSLYRPVKKSWLKRRIKEQKQ